MNEWLCPNCIEIRNSDNCPECNELEVNGLPLVCDYTGHYYLYKKSSNTEQVDA